MRVIYFDLDTLRPDHLGCYGYGRDTSPVIDSIARDGITFMDYYTPNAPCLPSRTSLFTGQYGVRTGIVTHTGTAADLRLEGRDRTYSDVRAENGLFKQFERAGMHTVSFSTFAPRHSAWWFNAGLREWVNIGKHGYESGELITPHVLDWLDRKGGEDNWFMHVHYWDPHTPFRVPEDFEDPFEGTPLPDDWITDEVFEGHLDTTYKDAVREGRGNLLKDERLGSSSFAKKLINRYDHSIRYTDYHVGQIIDKLKQMNIYDDDLAIIISTDHGENYGEIGQYCAHVTACEATCHIPMIIKWPGCKKGHKAYGFQENVDLLPTLVELLGLQPGSARPYVMDGVSYADTLLHGADCSKESLVLTNCVKMHQRAARFGDYIYIRTVPGQMKMYPFEMLFDIKQDPHMQNNLAASRPDLCAQGAKIILDWLEDIFKTSPYPTDPMWTVMREEVLKSETFLNGFSLRIREIYPEFGNQVTDDLGLRNK